MLIKPVETYYEETYFYVIGTKYPPSFWGIFLTDKDPAYAWIAAFKKEKDAIEFLKTKEQNAN